MPLVRYRHDFQIDEAIDAATGGSLTSPIPVADGGTGATDAATARTNLGLAIGTDVQAYDADLATWAGVTPSANGQSLVSAADYAAMRGLLDLEAGTDFYSKAAADAAFQPLDADLTTWAGLTPSANAQSLVTAANYAAMRALLDLEAGTDFYSIAAADAAFQPKDADLTALAGLTSAADKVPYFTGSGTAALADFTSYGRTLVALADETALEAVLDTLPNVTSIQGRTVTLADAGADALLGWDDSASAYQNLSAADARTALGLATTDSPQFAAINLNHASANTLTASGGHMTIEGATVWDSGNDGSGSGLDADLLDGKNIGTSGNTVPLLDGANTWSGTQTFGNTGIVVGASTPFSDSAGTLTLQNVDALDATTEATIEAAIDTLANLTSIQGRTVTLADAGADAIFGWDDSASAYQNLSAADVRTALGLVIGTNVQAYDADLTTWAGLTPSANAQSLVTAADYAAMRGLLDLEAGTDFLSPAAIAAAYQPLDADLTAIAGLTSAADKVPYFTGAGTAAVADFTSYGRTLVALADETALEAVLDTLPNLTSIQGRTVTLADAGANAIFGWDDTAGAYENLTAAEATATLNVMTGGASTGLKGLVPAQVAGDTTKFLRGDATWQTIPGGGDALTSGTLAQFAATTSLQLKGVISDETGSGALVFADTPTLVTPVLGTPTSGTLTNCTGLPVAGIAASTSTALGVGSLELGHATDTTLSRSAAGRLAVEGAVLGPSLQTATATTSGTTKDYNSIPSWVKRITVMFSGVSTNGSSDWLIQLGDSGGIETSGYLGASAQAQATTSAANSTAGFIIRVQNASGVGHGAVTLTMFDSSANTWVASGCVGFSNGAAVAVVGGSKSLSAALDRIRVTSVTPDTFDAGSINIMWE